MIQLYYYPGNASLAPHMLLEEIGEPFELVLVDRANAAQKSAEYLKLNPNGQIPVLVDGEFVLYEAAAICLYLADRYAQAKLVPQLATDERAHLYQWLFWCTNTLQAMLMHYFYSERMVDDGDVRTAEQVKRRAEMRAGAMLDRLDEQLDSHGGPWLRLNLQRGRSVCVDAVPLDAQFRAPGPQSAAVGAVSAAHARAARDPACLCDREIAAAVRVTRPTRGGMQRTRAPRSP